MRDRNGHGAAFIKELQHLSQSQSIDAVFTTFLEITATCIAAQVDPYRASEHEQHYRKITRDMTPKVLDTYARMIAQLWLLTAEHKDDPCDLLGGIYHKLRLHNKWNGQFFTPDSVCRMMAMITMSADQLGKGPTPITVNEPTCGSGAMVIGAVWAMDRAGFDFRHKAFFVAQDIDIRCVWMTYIQLSMYEIPAVVIHGNTLSAKEWSRWYTPYAAIPFLEQSSLDGCA